MFEQFTDRLRKVNAFACQEAQKFNHDRIKPEHYLLGLIKEKSGVGITALKNLYIDKHKNYEELESKIIARMKAGEDTVMMGKIPASEQAKKIIEYAIEEARALGHDHVGTEHLLIALLREQPYDLAYTILTEEGFEYDEVRNFIIKFLGEEEKHIIPSCENCKIHSICITYHRIEEATSNLELFFTVVEIYRKIEELYKVVGSGCQFYRRQKNE